MDAVIIESTLDCGGSCAAKVELNLPRFALNPCAEFV
jgi:hypothetical protein